MAGMVVAQEAFICKIDGKEEMIHAGDIVAADHEIVLRTPADWWRPIATRFAAVEQATAAPGEKRVASQPEPKVEAKAKAKPDAPRK